MPTISPSALQQLQRLYQISGKDVNDGEISPSSESRKESIFNDTSTTGNQLPPAVVAILKENRSKQQYRSKEKIENITRDLSNVDLD